MHHSRDRMDSPLFRESFRQGDKEAWDTVVATYYADLNRVAQKVTKDPYLAMEAVHNAIEWCRTNAAKYRVEHHPFAFVYKYVVRRAIDELREGGRRGKHVQSGEIPEYVAEERSRIEEVLDLRRAMQTLPEAQRRVVELHYVEGFKHSEIGDQLGISGDASRCSASRALAALRSEFRPSAVAGGSKGYDYTSGRVHPDAAEQLQTRGARDDA